MKVYVFIDVQNDFITGSLANKDAELKLPYIEEKIKEISKEDFIFFTLDRHFNNYLNTQEGKNLPISHCEYGTKGAELAIEKDILNYHRYCFVPKSQFGSFNLSHFIRDICYNTYNPFSIRHDSETFPISMIEKVIDEIVFMGFVTDICVISNVLICKTAFPEIKITVDAAGCAGTTEEGHRAALRVMQSCQVHIINEGVIE